jgi:hypothetical protein
MEVRGPDPQQVLVEYDQIRSPSGLDSSQGHAPARRPVGLLGVRPKGLGEGEPLLGMEGFGIGLGAAATHEGRLEGEKRPRPIEWRVGPE